MYLMAFEQDGSLNQLIKYPNPYSVFLKIGTIIINDKFFFALQL